MLTVDEAFRKFKSRLELNDREQKNASARHTEVRGFVRTKFAIDRDFLTGSYARYTKTKPLKDIDIFFVMKQAERHYREKAAGVVLDKYKEVLVEKYGEKAVRRQSRSINIDFGVDVKEEDKTDYKILSVDVVPAFDSGDDYEIPDGDTGKWIKTNPQKHAEKAVDAHRAYGSEWKGLVRMAKYWNNNKKHGEKPVKPSFLIEVIALDCLYGGWSGQFDREMQAFFATLAQRIGETWADPAGLGPPISASMDATRIANARRTLEEAARQAGIAINHVRQGRNGEALRTWRELFGPMFPLS
ncbi:CBASS oligonucleotide cyclase [Thauera linaloolentis]|uniref:DNA polymerase beta domain-containing protein region n=1 Tax=Thauera linaloolentis (strain DSM 12138 / JCM 21573 / CCUG 41526 / CIP 105981 / IAM 15112 / NBRC 102519 / 47Lol) TaxID=1123367 RepID=N6YFC6_THAL4|nr:CBASS oligonucleotide cyclase [Thauera linaloolentis]ENO90220.1 DNA polymerase beta domain-containing protein region [Thauera linaloolentis 47Lol = DSM 12138]MCM8566289.1 nucleotidyltransferase [Thauera linaloolentis]